MSLCTCGHDISEHVHRHADCFRCDCPAYTDANDLDMHAPRGYLVGQRRINGDN